MKITETSNSSLSSIKQFVWSDADERCEEFDATGAALSQFFTLGQQVNGIPYFCTKDHLSSIRGLHDSSASQESEYFFDSYGRSSVISTGQISNLQYAGYYRHSRSGLSFSLTRAYSPNLGSWLSRDALEEVEGTNLHAYVDNNPISYFDPSGQAKKGGGRVKTLLCLLLFGACLNCEANACELFWNFCVDDCGKKNKGRNGKQKRLKDLSNDPKVSSRDRGWMKQEQNQIARGTRDTIRVPPGKVMAHERGREASKGYGYEHSHLQDKDLHDTQHKYDNNGRANKERPLMPKWCK